MSLNIARELNSFGFAVDVFDWLEPGDWAASRYDVLFGMGPHYERFRDELPSGSRSIYYGTGAHCRYEDEREWARAEYLQQRRGVWIEPRGMPQNACAEESDAVVALAGNDHIFETWAGTAPVVRAVNNFALPFHELPDLRVKDYSPAKMNFLWIGGVYQLLRGLDLVLEAFADLPQTRLWICAPLEDARDSKFVREYRRELFACDNISTIGWVDPRSTLLRRLADRCAFAIYASCTESMSGSVLTAMRLGLIPLVTRSCGVNVDDCGLGLTGETVEGIRDTIAEASLLSDNRCRDLATEAVHLASAVYTKEQFSRGLHAHLSEILGDA